MHIKYEPRGKYYIIRTPNHSTSQKVFSAHHYLLGGAIYTTNPIVTTANNMFITFVPGGTQQR